MLVERVEGFCTEAAWRYAYGEINDFEEQLVDDGVAVCKFWLHIDPDEQVTMFSTKLIYVIDQQNFAVWPHLCWCLFCLVYCLGFNSLEGH